MSRRAKQIALASREGTIKRLHVDRHVIAANHKHGKFDPPISVQTSQGTLKAGTVEINGPSTIIYGGECQLSCGARLWIETKAAINGDWS